MHLSLEPYDGTYTMLGEKVHASDGSQFNADAYRMRIVEEVVPHSFAKHCFYKDEPYMTGAISRFTLFSGGMTGRAKELAGLYAEYLDPNNPLSNNFAQAVELVYFIHKALDISNELASDMKVNEKRVKPVYGTAGTGVSMSEAPRGLLAYTIGVGKDGRVKKTDIITPTTMFLPLMEQDLGRTAEALLEQCISDNKVIAQKLETVVRSYDPCVSCSVHVTEVK
jgi:sulfhydrogenase subunit alpha